MDVKKQNLRNPASALKRDCSIDDAHKWQESTLSGKEKDTKTQETVQSRSMKCPSNKPQQVSDSMTQSNNQICISELKNRKADLLQQLSEVLNENRQLKTLHHRNNVALQHYQNAENGIYMTIVKQTNEVQTLTSLLRQTRACRNNTAAKLNATEDRLLNTNDSFQHLQRLSQDHNLLEQEQLTCMMAEVSANLEQKNKRIKDLERYARLSRAWFNFQLASGQRVFNIMMSCSCPEHNLTQDRLDEASNLQTQKILKRVAKLASQSKEIQAYGLVLPPTEALGPVKSETYETVQLEEQQEEQQLELQLELLEELLEEQDNEQLDMLLEELLGEQLKDQEDAQLEEQEYVHLEEQEHKQLEEQHEEQKEEQEYEQLEEQEDEQEDKQKNPANWCCYDPVQASLDNETEDPTNSIKSHVDDPAEEFSESPVASEALVAFKEKQKIQEHVFKESLKMLTKAKQNHSFKQTIDNLHKGIPAFRCEYVRNPTRSQAIGSRIRKLSPKSPQSGKPTRRVTCSPLNRDATMRKFSHWVINR